MPGPLLQAVHPQPALGRVHRLLMQRVAAALQALMELAEKLGLGSQMMVVELPCLRKLAQKVALKLGKDLMRLQLKLRQQLKDLLQLLVAVSASVCFLQGKTGKP